ncbi:MAG: hypothetical protein QOJ19_1130 [Acidimicrobiia bacterium]|jgi:hypothetical protein|nr:hypothetical protein [Acidimicrobiia bacterium]
MVHRRTKYQVKSYIDRLARGATTSPPPSIGGGLGGWVVPILSSLGKRLALSTSFNL